jgi:cell division protein ZapA (FtsZ GTPase activity inhibitor)
MTQVNVTINGRQFRMACEDGEEERLARLAEDLDARIWCGQFARRRPGSLSRR